MRLIVKAIGKGGGNNEKRFIMITPLAAGYISLIESNVVFPDDLKYNTQNYFILSVHMYSTYHFRFYL